jgi:hypothetical protein
MWDEGHVVGIPNNTYEARRCHIILSFLLIDVKYFFTLQRNGSQIHARYLAAQECCKRHKIIFYIIQRTNPLEGEEIFRGVPFLCYNSLI